MWASVASSVKVNIEGGSFSVPPSTEKVSAPVSKERQTIFSLPPLVSSSNPNLVVIPLRGISALAVTVI